MGVPELKKSFIKNQKLFKEFRIQRGQHAVIDEHILLRQMCEQQPILYGGEYQTIYETTKEFLQKMVRVAGISLVIVREGAWADVKYETIMYKHKKCLTNLKEMVERKDNRSLYLPAFAMKCFTDAVDAFKEEYKDDASKVEIITAEFEADPELVKKATERSCPVISTDTDMIIFNIPEGYVDIASLKWKDIKKGFVDCQRVMSKDVAKALGLEVNMLPLFATLRTYYDDYGAYGKGPNTTNNKEIYQWMTKFIKENGANDHTVLMALGLEAKDLEKLKKRIDSYSIRNMEADQVDLPERIRKLIDTGRLYHGAKVVLKQGMFIPKKQIEDFSKPSSNDVSRNIRCMWYSMICAGERDSVIEYTRTSGSTERLEDIVMLKKQEELPDGTLIDLTTCIDELDAKKIILHILECQDGKTDLKMWSDGGSSSRGSSSSGSSGSRSASSSSSSSGGSGSMELPAIVTKYWHKKTSPDKRIADALLQFLQKTNRLEEDGAQEGKDEAQKGWTEVCRSRRQKKKSPKNAFNIDIAHAYAQWQSCLLAAYDLNVILGYPIPDFKINDLLRNGSLLHQQYATTV